MEPLLCKEGIPLSLIVNRNGEKDTLTHPPGSRALKIYVGSNWVIDISYGVHRVFNRVPLNTTANQPTSRLATQPLLSQANSMFQEGKGKEEAFFITLVIQKVILSRTRTHICSFKNSNWSRNNQKFVFLHFD